MQREYTPVAATTDFGLVVALRAAVVGKQATDAELEKVFLFPPTLGPNSVRFARNHDTILNSELQKSMGFKSGDERCTLIWIFLLALADGTVLVFPEDEGFCITGVPVIQTAVRFRRAMTHRAMGPHVILRVIPPPPTTESLNSAGGLGSCNSLEADQLKTNIVIGSQVHPHDGQINSFLNSIPRETTVSAPGAEEILADAEEIMVLGRAASRIDVQRRLLDLADSLRQDAEKILRKGTVPALSQDNRPSSDLVSLNEEQGSKGIGVCDLANDPETRIALKSSKSKDQHVAAVKKCKETPLLMAVCRPGGGFVLLNFRKTWASIRPADLQPVLKVAGLRGKLREQVYGFDVDVDSEFRFVSHAAFFGHKTASARVLTGFGRLVSWGGHRCDDAASDNHAKVGPLSALIFMA